MTDPRPAVLVVDVPADSDAAVEVALGGAGYRTVRVASLADAPAPGPDAPVAVLLGEHVPHVGLGELGVPVVVLVTAGGAGGAVDDAIRRGAHDVLRLPLDGAELVSRVRAAERVTRLAAEVRELTRRDQLTGLSNRRHLDEQFVMLSGMARRLRTPFSILMVDIDRTRRVNDELGTEAGDAVVAEVARRVAAGLRGEDVAGRWSGEEFMVLLPHTPLDGAWRLADRIRASICDAPIPLPGGGDVLVTVSIGCADGFGDDRADHLRRAHAALDDAKAGGRNRVVASV